MCRTKAGPRDGDLWLDRLKEEYQALIRYVENNKSADNDWFRLESNTQGTRLAVLSRVELHCTQQKSTTHKITDNDKYDCGTEIFKTICSVDCLSLG